MADDKTEKPFIQSDIAKKIIVGGIAGFIEATINFWLYSTKTRLQDEKIPKEQKITFNPRVLYRGFLPFVSFIVPIRATQFGATEAVRSTIKSVTKNQSLSDLELFYSACIGGGVSGIIAAPVEMTIARQTQEIGFLGTLKNMIKDQGYRILFLGMPGSAFRNSFFNAGTLAGVPIIRKALEPQVPNAYVQVTAALLAGTCAAAISQPFDTIKTRQQTDRDNMQGRKFKSMRETAHKMWTNEGLFSFYKGGAPRVVRVLGATQIISKAELEIRSFLGW